MNTAQILCLQYNYIMMQICGVFIFQGVGTLARKMSTEPKKTIRAENELKKSYTKMRQANEIGGNLAAHREANREATRKSDAFYRNEGAVQESLRQKEP